MKNSSIQVALHSDLSSTEVNKTSINKSTLLRLVIYLPELMFIAGLSMISFGWFNIWYLWIFTFPIILKSIGKLFQSFIYDLDVSSDNEMLQKFQEELWR